MVACNPSSLQKLDGWSGLEALGYAQVIGYQAEVLHEVLLTPRGNLHCP